ncbi:MAG: hypothetical protein JXR76_06600 [Deltaproteobacteria bacterium]|nr:hypothetical protein [Deltaproteobacteria bacterium]
MRSIAPDHACIRYVGRVDFSNSQMPSFSFPGVNIRIRFRGRTLQALLYDNAPTNDDSQANWFAVVVDGEMTRRLKICRDNHMYCLAEHLSDAVHEVMLFKQSESGTCAAPNVGKVTFGGFMVDDDATLLEPASRSLRMEFVGGSITCGYGNRISTFRPGNYSPSTEMSDAFMAYGAIAARMLNAEYVAVAYSGRGVVRNSGDVNALTIPDMYLKTLPDDPSGSSWNPDGYIPDIVVVNLGTNDFSRGMTSGRAQDALEQRFVQRYQAFLHNMMQYYPRARFVLVMGPMLSNRYFSGCNVRKMVRRCLRKIVDASNQSGGRRVSWLEMSPQQPPYGVDYHPTISTHTRMARRLALFIRIAQRLLWD